jgi:hypothetical protein
MLLRRFKELDLSLRTPIIAQLIILFRAFYRIVTFIAVTESPPHVISFIIIGDCSSICATVFEIVSYLLGFCLKSCIHLSCLPYLLYTFLLLLYAMAQAVSSWYFKVGAGVLSQATACGVRIGRNDTGTSFCSTSVSLCQQQHSSNASY